MNAERRNTLDALLRVERDLVKVRRALQADETQTNAITRIAIMQGEVSSLIQGLAAEQATREIYNAFRHERLTDYTG